MLYSKDKLNYEKQMECKLEGEIAYLLNRSRFGFSTSSLLFSSSSLAYCVLLLSCTCDYNLFTKD